MASPKGKSSRKEGASKKTYNGQGKFTKYGNPGPYGGNKKYKKKYRGQGNGNAPVAQWIEQRTSNP